MSKKFISFWSFSCSTVNWILGSCAFEISLNLFALSKSGNYLDNVCGAGDVKLLNWLTTSLLAEWWQHQHKVPKITIFNKHITALRQKLKFYLLVKCFNMFYKILCNWYFCVLKGLKTWKIFAKVSTLLKLILFFYFIFVG